MLKVQYFALSKPKFFLAKFYVMARVIKVLPCDVLGCNDFLREQEMKTLLGIGVYVCDHHENLALNMANLERLNNAVYCLTDKSPTETWDGHLTSAL